MKFKEIKDINPGDRCIVLGVIIGMAVRKTDRVLLVQEGSEPRDVDCPQQIRIAVENVTLYTTDGNETILAAGSVYQDGGALPLMKAELSLKNAEEDQEHLFIKMMQEMQ